MDQFQIYKDIEARTGGEVYIGVVGPVRTGKSTFIRRFMELAGLPQLSEYEQQEIKDQLPVSGSGKMITTVEPKFIPRQGFKLNVSSDINIKVRLIDCVGFLIPGVEGVLENGSERMIKTPWKEEEIPFKLGAELGTKKVIEDHATVGILVTTDGTFGDIPRENFVKAEEEIVQILKNKGKPFIILMNSKKPYGQEVKDLIEQLSNKYNSCILPMNCDQLRQDDINRILENILYEFPITKIDFHIPKWSELLPVSHPLKMHMIERAKEAICAINNLHDIRRNKIEGVDEYINRAKIDKIDSSTGILTVRYDVDDSYYYMMLSDMTEVCIKSEYDLINLLKDLSKNKIAYHQVENAIDAVRNKGYGIVMPYRDEIELEDPELIKQGNKYGVLIRAHSPSIHMIRANIETEIAPIVGSEEQAKDLIAFIEQAKDSDDGIWMTNIFGKTIEQLVGDEIQNKVNQISDASQQKLQESMDKIVNDSKGGMVCIII